MSSQHPYSTVECFFVFNSIRRCKLRPLPFDDISKSLKENDQLVKNRTPAYLARFGPEAIKELYLALTKEEARSRAFGQDHSIAINGSGEDGNSRDEPIEEEDLINYVHYKYYTRFRDEAIASLRADEEAYLALKRRVEEAEKAQKDAVKAKSPKAVPSIDNLLQNDRAEDATESISSPKDLESPTPGSAEPVGSNGALPTTVQKPLLVQAGEESPKVPVGKPLEPRQSLLEGRQLPNAYVPQSIPPLRPPPSDTQPFLPPPIPTAHSYSDVPPPLPDVHRRPSFPASQPSPELSLRSPGLPQSTLPPRERPSSGSSIILPPPPGMVRATSSGATLDPFAENPMQQYRAPSAVSSSRPSQSPSLPPASRHLPQPRNFSQTQYTYYDTQASPTYPPYGQHLARGYPNPQQGQLPLSYQPPPSNAAIYGSPSQYPSAPNQYTYPSYSQGSPYYPPGPVQSSLDKVPKSARITKPVPSTPATVKPGLPQLSPIHTGGSATKWKSTQDSTRERQQTPTSPGPEDMSPVEMPSPSPEAVRSEPKPVRRGRGRPPRRGGSTTRATRGESAKSATASTVDVPPRSPSDKSRPDEPSNIKDEPPATPVADDTATDTSLTVKPRRGRRSTVRALELDAPASSTRSAGMTPLLKRKREAEIQETPTTSPTTPLAPKQPVVPASFTRLSYVTGMRNFPRTSQTIMNDITSHKHAYMFQQPLSNRQAPGYRDLIYRPQDLKSIKTAIGSGSRALIASINAGIERADTPASVRTVTGDQSIAAAGSPAALGNTPVPVHGQGTASLNTAASANVVTVPTNPDIVPPKGIINSAQFEKEVMRTFANAIMFNPDPKRGFPKSVLRRIRKGDGRGLKERHIPKGMQTKPDRRQRGRRKAPEAEAAEVEEEDTDGEQSLSDSNAEDNGDSSEGWLGNEKDRDVVHDTREMFDAIEEKMAQWREAERAAENRSRLRGGDGGSDDEAEGDREAGVQESMGEEESKVEAASSEVERGSGLEGKGRASKRRKR